MSRENKVRTHDGDYAKRGGHPGTAPVSQMPKVPSAPASGAKPANSAPDQTSTPAPKEP